MSLLKIVIPKQKKGAIEIQDCAKIISQVVFFQQQAFACWVLTAKYISHTFFGLSEDIVVSVTLREKEKNVDVFVLEVVTEDEEVLLEVTSVEEVKNFPVPRKKRHNRALLEVIVPEQYAEKDSRDWLDVERETVFVAEVICFYKSQGISYWQLNPKQLQFSTIGNDFSSIKLRKDADGSLCLNITYETEVTGEIDRNLRVESMRRVLDFPS